jgi:hypothetical protein
MDKHDISFRNHTLVSVGLSWQLAPANSFTLSGYTHEAISNNDRLSFISIGILLSEMIEQSKCLLLDHQARNIIITNLTLN